jgi:hypothetical protein
MAMLIAVPDCRARLPCPIAVPDCRARLPCPIAVNVFRHIKVIQFGAAWEVPKYRSAEINFGGWRGPDMIDI